MSGDWKPGDVAMLMCRDGQERIAILTDRGDLAPLWIACAEEWGRLNEVAVRPLVVIDPEDRAAVERLRDIYDVEVISQNGDPDPRDVTPGHRGNALQAALREFATPTPPTPPKPDEPSGLGAVVEDAEGDRWYRTANANVGTDDVAEGGAPCAVWKRDNTNRLQEKVAFSWREIHVVRVLSEGVTP